MSTSPIYVEPDTSLVHWVVARMSQQGLVGVHCGRSYTTPEGYVTPRGVPTCLWCIYMQACRAWLCDHFKTQLQQLSLGPRSEPVE